MNNQKMLMLHGTLIDTSKIIYCFSSEFQIVIYFENKLNCVIDYEEEEEELFKKDFRNLTISLSGVTDYIEIEKMNEKITKIEEDLKHKYNAMYEEKCFNDKIEKVTLTDQKNYAELKLSKLEVFTKEVYRSSSLFGKKRIRKIKEAMNIKDDII